MTSVKQQVDEVSTSGISRRHFIQSAAAAGVAIPFAQIMGGASVGAASKVLRVAGAAVQKAVTPFTTADMGSLQILGQVGEYLAWSNAKSELEPRVAESWKSSKASTVWTYKIRKGIKFHDGTPLTADDVVWTIKSHLDPANASQSLGKFKGILQSSGVKKIDAYTVQFTLDGSVGAFADLLSSNSYGLIIVKNNVLAGGAWEDTMIGCGPWMLDKYVKGEKITLKKNPNYWDTSRQPAFDSLVITQFASADAAAAQLRTGKLDAIAAVTPVTALSLPKAKTTLVRNPTAAGIHVHMRTNFGPFQDKRVRQAAALTLDRKGYIKGVLKGFGAIGNDSVMDVYSTADKSIPQREKDIAKAKSLMAAAGVTNGFTVNLSSYERDDIVKLSQVVKSSFAEIGINVVLKLHDAYYSPPWSSQDSAKVDTGIWLQSNLGITDWGHRGAPVEYLVREWKSTGDWNAAQFRNTAFDKAADAFIAAGNPAKAKVASKDIQKISLEETPYIIIYFDSVCAAMRKSLTGFYTTGMYQIETAGARNV